MKLITLKLHPKEIRKEVQTLENRCCVFLMDNTTEQDLLAEYSEGSSRVD